MAAHKTDKRNGLYADLMEEVKVRLEYINQVANGRGNFHPIIVREFCYLQLRVICELVALGCLVAHGDVSSYQSHKVGKTYSADEILTGLEKLKPHFYPIPVQQIRLAPNKFELKAIEPSPLSKGELISLYQKTHRYLHRGSLKQMLSTKIPINKDVKIPEIIGSAQKIADLLSHHIIAITDDHVMVCMLKNPDDDMKVQVATAAKPPLK